MQNDDKPASLREIASRIGPFDNVDKIDDDSRFFDGYVGAVIKIILFFCFAFAVFRGGWLIVNGSEPFYNNDEPRQIMTSVFWYDFIRYHPLNDPYTFVMKYYGHYPAIAPLHWPPMQHCLTAATFLIFGPSISLARGLILCMYILMLILSYRLVRDHIGRVGAAAATILLMSAPAVLTFQAIFMLEIPSMFWMVASIYCLSWYLQNTRPWRIYLCAACLIFALLTKQHSLAIGLPILLGAILKFTRKQWLNIHVWIAGLAVILVVGGYYTFALTHITSSGKDLSVSGGSISGDMYQILIDFTPVLIGLGVIGICVLFTRDRRNWLGWVSLIWIAGIFSLYMAAGIKVSRYLVYSAVPLSFLAGLAIEFLCRRSARIWAVAIMCCLMVLACRNFLDIPGARLVGVKNSVDRLNCIACSQPVLYCGRYDGPFILYRRLASQDLNSVTLRIDKMIGCGNILPDRDYQPQVDSCQEIIQKLKHMGITLLVVEDLPAIKAREYYWFWNLLKDPELFREIESVDIVYPNGRKSQLRLIRYIGPVVKSDKLWIPMPTLAKGGFYVNTNWNADVPDSR